MGSVKSITVIEDGEARTRSLYVVGSRSRNSGDVAHHAKWSSPRTASGS